VIIAKIYIISCLIPNKQPKDKTEVDFIQIYNQQGTLIHTVKSTNLRYTGISSFFNNSIYYKNKHLYYKEEFSDVVYSIDSDFKKDSVFSVSLSGYGFQKEDFDLTKSTTWARLYRVQNFLLFDQYIFIRIQKGVVGEDFYTLTFNKQTKNVKKGLTLDGIKLTPLSDYENELICEVSIDGLATALNTPNHTISSELSRLNVTENSNPILAILTVDK